MANWGELQETGGGLGGAPLTAALRAAARTLARGLRPSVVEVLTPGHGGGAGTIWRPHGLIVTNQHVAPAGRVGVVLADGRRLPGWVVGVDPANDLAVVSVEATDLPAVTVGDAGRLRVGQLVLAIGHPFGRRGALSLGVVGAAPPGPADAVGRELIRADLLLGPGSSGGPLIDVDGRVVGINALIAGGLGLAIPSHLAERLVWAVETAGRRAA